MKALENDDVTVLIVCNGPGAKVEWKVPMFISALKSYLTHGELELVVTNATRAIKAEATDRDDALQPAKKRIRTDK